MDLGRHAGRLAQVECGWMVCAMSAASQPISMPQFHGAGRLNDARGRRA